MCSAISDGAAAAIVTRAEHPTATAARRWSSRASALRAATRDGSTSRPWPRAPPAAYEEAGIGPEDVDVVEVHDAMAPGELLYYEQLGFCEPGEAARLLRSGATASADAPVNPSGGLSSRGHPVGATGLAQMAELTWQLRGEAGERQADGARIALAQNSGGWLEGESAACNVHILERLAS